MSEKWTSDNIPNQGGKVAIVTGSTSGIGKETAKVIAGKGGKVVLAVRNKEKGKQVIEEIKAEYENADVEVRKLDLTSLESVKSFADSILKDYNRLDVLINNAGIMMCPYSKTKNDFEIQMGTNHLGHFALTGRLFPLLKKTPDSRLVVLSSGAHAMGNININDINWESRAYNTQRAYGDSKLANLYFAYELARRLENDGSNPRVTAAHPGWTETDLQRHSGLMRVLNKVFAQDVDMGALPTLRAAYDDAAKAGQFFGPSGRGHMNGYPVAHESNDKSYNKEIAKKLWKVSEELTEVLFNI